VLGHGFEVMDWMSAPTKAAQEAGRNVGGIKASKTISLPISYWALIEQIRTRKGFKNGNETLCYTVMELAKELGIETG
jgi:hypothetical protein